MTDKRYLQANKEARLSLYITLFYMVSWILSAYFLSNKQGLFGFPAWFEVSCIFTPIGFIALCYIVVKTQFKNISLENKPNDLTVDE
ncbi:DUF997 family protein [Frischella sp. Ac48]|uniref:DUF997 family protein n=1 Tax=Frischella japonica TaxID=2741544 RepID=A0ABR7QY36_9GAMM|nr:MULTISPECIES: DUF997 family protein [Frischella]MBC9131137.1 DUF997 family protein [Frischella japonica]MBX4132109.1 DUF997 family protein [Frischella sp. Ac48]